MRPPAGLFQALVKASLVFLSLLPPARSAGASCPRNVTAEFRVECGYLGIQPDECNARDCCWRPDASGSGLPWCVRATDVGQPGCPVVQQGGVRDTAEDYISEHECRARDCCWIPSTTRSSPWCVYKRPLPCLGYDLAFSASKSPRHIVSEVTAQEPRCNVHGQDYKTLTVDVWFQTEQRARVRVRPRDRRNHIDVNSRADTPRKRHEGFVVDSQRKQTEDDLVDTSWEIPSSIVPDGMDGMETPLMPEDLQYEVKFTSHPFSFSVYRKGSSTPLFSTSNPDYPLVASPYFLQLATVLPSDAVIYGLGETVDSLRRNPDNTRQAFWARDAPSPVKENVYGVHPFYMEIQDGKAHGVFLRSSHPTDVILRSGSLVYRSNSEVLDLYFFVGPTPQDVVSQYLDLVGRPAMPPYWALGYMQSRYGFPSIAAARSVVSSFRDHQLPLDVLFLDIDYMSEYRDFTFDPIRFPLSDVRALLDEMHSRGQRVVVILDPGIKVEQGYKSYEEGVKAGCFIRNADGTAIEIGLVWPGYTAYPDWFHPNATSWWTREVRGLLEMAEVDGLWIDMNEPANFCSGSCFQNPVIKSPRRIGSDDDTQAVPPSSSSSPHYRVNNAGRNADLSEKTASVDALHYGGIREFNAHSLYGHMEAIATRKALTDIRPNMRPFILTRSSFSGTGSHAAHWLGDNWSTFQSMQQSISGVLNFQLFGIPMVGPDICGFLGEASEELCARWMEVGAFFPFSRNHNTIEAKDQEPFRWEVVAEASRRAMSIRYKLMPLYYTLLHFASKEGHFVLRALAWSYQEDPETYGIERQFLIGDSVLVSPVLEEHAREVVAYFPRGLWYDLATFEVLLSGISENALHRERADLTNGSGQWVRLLADILTIPLHVRGGAIIPQFFIPHQSVETAAQLLNRGEYSILVALDLDGKANGWLYVDDGESLHVDQGSMTEVYIECTIGKCVWKGTFCENSKPIVVREVSVLGLGCPEGGILNKPQTVTVAGMNINEGPLQSTPHWEWSESSRSGTLESCGGRSLRLVGLQINGLQEFSVTWK
ncbi:glycoside hydrolase family 31 protein [Gonapodya prolifera JEL478]|uniref:Maltase n=1 Tax=Gonapodya prolifera (strain JEL478) TaxID=1344416 RepID=A0A139AQM2_GONPJ|nr:glycoside hydrolase family 31 protein [Gonapodya prolifera JEL478]|eukprot:KXS19057.1 glycoside hydrolase family 31 protein [Gonapodya prolifera JEL478]